MTLRLLLALPVFSGLAAFFIRPHGLRRGLLVAAALGHAGLTASCWLARPAPLLWGYLGLDAAGLLFLSVTSALFLAAAVYSVSFLRRSPGEKEDEEGFMFDNAPEAMFTTTCSSSWNMTLAAQTSTSASCGWPWKPPPWPARLSSTSTGATARSRRPGSTSSSAPWASPWPCSGTSSSPWQDAPSPASR